MAQRTWFITGVSSGFGRHMTEQLLARGDRVAGTVRKMDTMKDLKASTATSCGSPFSTSPTRQQSSRL